MIEVAVDRLPAELVAAIDRGTIQVAYFVPETERYVVAIALPARARREIEWDVGLGRLLTIAERRAELPPPERSVLAESGYAIVTSYAIDAETEEKRVTFATEDGHATVECNVHVPIAWNAERLISSAIHEKNAPARYAALTRDEKIAHWVGVIHRYRRAHGERGRDEDEIWTPELVRDLERHEPALRSMLRPIVIEVGRLEQTGAEAAIAAFVSRTSIALDLTEWIAIAGGPFVLGLLPDEVDRLAEASARAARTRSANDPGASLADERELEATSGNVEYLRSLLVRAFPPRTVEIAPFTIARSPVTNREWKRFVEGAGIAPPDGWSVPGADADDRAVIGVSWEEANRYAESVGAKLPTEAQWERAARGVERRLFPWGNAWGDLGAWLDAQPYYDPWANGTHAELASADGVHDLVTRRWEWCVDPLEATDVSALEALYPALVKGGRVRRGGAGSSIVACALARTGTRASWRADGTGFRLVR